MHDRGAQGPPPGFLEAVADGWTGLALHAGGDGPVLLYAGELRDSDDPLLEVRAHGAASGAATLTLVISPARGPGEERARSAIDLRRAAGRRLVQELVGRGIVPVWIAPAGSPERARGTGHRLTPALVRCLRDVAALAGEWHPHDPPPLGLPARTLALVGARAPVLVASRAGRHDVSVVVPADVVPAPGALARAAIRPLAAGDSLVLTVTAPGEPARALRIPLPCPGQRRLARRLAGQAEIGLVSADPVSGLLVAEGRAMAVPDPAGHRRSRRT